MARRSALLLCDATVPRNFCKVSLEAAAALSGHLGDSAFVVTDVKDELERRAETDSVVARFLDTGWPPNDAIVLPPEVRLIVADIMVANRQFGAHPNEDIGETATIEYAKHEKDNGGREFNILTDDSGGKRLARDRGLTWKNTPALLVEMVCSGSMSVDLGQQVWNATLSKPEARAAYASRLREVCPAVLE